VKSTLKPLLPPEEVYAQIREDYPDESFGNAWEGVGAHIANGVWADPEECGYPGEYELLYSAYLRSLSPRSPRKAPRKPQERPLPYAR
jgi:hypothetical protein